MTNCPSVSPVEARSSPSRCRLDLLWRRFFIDRLVWSESAGLNGGASRLSTERGGLRRFGSMALPPAAKGLFAASKGLASILVSERLLGLNCTRGLPLRLGRSCSKEVLEDMLTFDPQAAGECLLNKRSQVRCRVTWPQRRKYQTVGV
jgi:hypothetical protein